MAKARGVGLVLAALAVVLMAGRSPELERVRNGGPGGDIGNREQPVRLHGGRTPSNPDLQVPGKIQAPREAWDAPGWWAGRAA